MDLALKAPVMSTDTAAKILERIRNIPDGNRRPCTLDGETVMVRPLHGNAFRIMSVPRGDPAAGAGYRLMKDLGAEPSVERDSGSLRYWTCEVTWDTALHYLARAGHLSTK